MLMIGYFEGLGSERAIAWRVADSLALREFLGYPLTEPTPRITRALSRIRQRLPEAVHEAVFDWVLKVLSDHELLKGKTVAVDATPRWRPTPRCQHRASRHRPRLPGLPGWTGLGERHRETDPEGGCPARQEARQQGVQPGLGALPA